MRHRAGGVATGRRGIAFAPTAIAVAVALVLGWHGVNGVRVTAELAAGQTRNQAAAVQGQLDCLRDRLADLVPPGSTVHVPPPPSTADLAAVEAYDRVVEFLWRAGALPVAAPSEANVNVSLHVSEGFAGCQGVELVAA